MIRSRPMELGATLVDERIEGEGKNRTRAILWKLRLGGEWTVPVVELVRGEPKATSLLVADKGRGSVADAAEGTPGSRAPRDRRRPVLPRRIGDRRP